MVTTAPGMPVKITRSLYRGDSRVWTHVFTDTATGLPIDLTGYTFLSQYRPDLDRGTVIASATCAVGGADSNIVTETLSAAQANLLPGETTTPPQKSKIYWDLQSTDPDGNVQTWYFAAVSVQGDASDAA